MRDDPRRNLKELEEALLYEEICREFRPEPEKPLRDTEEDLMERVDQLLEDLEPEAQEEGSCEEYREEEEPPIRNYANRYAQPTRAQQAAKNKSPQKLDKNAAVLVKTRRQLKQEEKLRKKQAKKSGVNRNLTGLTILAILEILGILAIMVWWLQ